MVEEKEFKHIIRIANTDLDGNKPIYHALRKIKGLSFMFSGIVCHLANVDKTAKAGNLSENEIEKLDSILREPKKHNIPSWMLNRRKDYETGDDKHLLTGDLKFVKENDIKRLKMIKSYRGYRHAYGLPSRGQKTKSNFRRNKGKVTGVKRKSGVKAGRV